MYHLQSELHRTHLSVNGDIRGRLYSVFRIRNELAELKLSVNDLQLVNLIVRSLPQQLYYNKLRRKVLFSFNMGKYTPELLREMILTTAARKKDWESNGFGNHRSNSRQDVAGRESRPVRSSPGSKTQAAAGLP